MVIDNHFGVPDSAVDYLKPPKEFPLSQIKFSLTTDQAVPGVAGDANDDDGDDNNNDDDN